MAKPKPPEELVGISIRPPKSLHSDLTELAAASGVSLNKYIVRVLADAAERGVSLETRLREDRPKKGYGEGEKKTAHGRDDSQ